MISVLCVDDEPDLLEICREFLEETGYFSVDTTPEPTAVFSLLEKKRYDAIICDYHMPGLDGISLLKEIRRIPNDVPFILFTGRGREEVVIGALNNGADFYLQKGGDVTVQFTELASKVRQAVLRRQAQDSLRESEKMLFDIINFLPDATFAINRSGVVIAWNRAIEEMTGVPAVSMIGKKDYEYAVPFYGTRRPILIDLIFESDETVTKNYAEIIREKDVLVAQTGQPKPRGVPCILSERASPLYNQAGEIVGAIESIRDVTREREREDALIRSERMYRDLADLLPQIVVEMDAGLNVTFANQNALAMLGLSREDLDTGVNAIDFIDPAEHENVRENLARIIRKEPYGIPEFTAVRKDKSTFPVRIYASPVFQDDRLTGFRAVIVDISDWKTAADAQRVSEERYLSLADAAQDLIYIIDKDDVVIYINRYGQEMMKKNREEIVSHPRKQLFPDDVSARQYQSIQRVFTTGRPLRIESRIPLPDRETWQDTLLVPLRDAEGSITSVMGISRDISQIKLAETALRRSNEKLNLLNSITRHDVANQLTILNGYIQLAMMKDTGAVLGDFLKKIDNACSTIQRQMEFTRTYQDLGIRAPDWFRLDQVIAKTRPAGLAFTCLCNDYEIYADPMLEKVFFNLFDNAVRHGERVTSIMVRCDPAGDELSIVIEDDGIGIPLDMKQKIFSKGYGRNTGYGLFLVREILAITNITIHETGKAGSGARFEIAVPKGGFRRGSSE